METGDFISGNADNSAFIGDEMGSLEPETIKYEYGRESHGTRTRK
jgi:hypothetical protein